MNPALARPLAFAAFAAIAAAQGPKHPQFPAYRAPVPGDATAVELADVNGDSIPDICYIAQNNFTFGSALGDGYGKFQYLQSTSTGGSAFDFALGDFNNDGSIDAAITNPTNNGVAIALGTISGAFNPPAFFQTGTDPRGICAADFDGNGNLDIAVAHHNASKVTICFGDGTGGIPVKTDIGVGANPFAIAAADFDGGGILDIAIAHDSGAKPLTVILGIGAGLFAAPQTFASVWPLKSLAIGNVDNNAFPDIVAASPTAGGIVLFAADGLGGFVPHAIPVGSNATVVRLADIEGDGDLDAITTLGTVLPQATFAVSHNNGVGVFAPAQLHKLNIVCHDFATGDVNRDGYLDIALAGLIPQNSGFGIPILFGTPSGLLAEPAKVTTGANTRDVAIVDINNDGTPDLLTANYDSASISAHLGTGGGAFAPRIPAATQAFPIALATGDFNNDGKLDAVTSHETNKQFTVLLGDGAGNFTSVGTPPTGPANEDVATGDFNVDGNLDFVVTHYSNFGVTFFYGNGAGGVIAQAVATPSQPWGVATGDVNNDGLPDAVIAHVDGRSLSSFLSGLPPGTAPVVTYVAIDLRGICLGHFNNDGFLDAAAGLYEPRIFSGLGNGGFVASPYVAIPSGFGNPVDFKAADLDGDGRAEIVTSNSNNITIRSDDGSGQYAATESYYLLPGAAWGIAAGDLDGDALPDIAAAMSNADLAILTQQKRQFPKGTLNFGTGTAGCAGYHNFEPMSTPVSGSQHFEVRCDAAPPSSMAAAFLGDAPSQNGSNPFNLGILLHVDFLASTFIETFPFFSDSAGNATAQLAVPANPAIIGNTYFAQVAWYWQAGCSLPPFQLSSSNGIAIQILPPG